MYFKRHHVSCSTKFNSGSLIRFSHKATHQVRWMVILQQHKRKITDIKFNPVKLSRKPEEKRFSVT